MKIVSQQGRSVQDLLAEVKDKFGHKEFLFLKSLAMMISSGVSPSNNAALESATKSGGTDHPDEKQHPKNQSFLRDPRSDIPAERSLGGIQSSGFSSLRDQRSKRSIPFSVVNEANSQRDNRVLQQAHVLQYSEPHDRAEKSIFRSIRRN